MASEASPSDVSQFCNVCGKTGTILKCGRCKHTNYCSKPCQVQDWPLHKMYCKDMVNSLAALKGMMKETLAPSMTVSNVNLYQGVCIALELDDPNSNYLHCSYRGSPIYGAGPTDSTFVESPMSRAIGFTLGAATAGLKAHLSVQVPNSFVEKLCVDIDPDSPGFGMPLRSFVGAVMLSRVDSRQVKIIEVVAVVEFAEWMGDELALVLKREAKGKKVDRKEVVKSLFTPKAFASRFEKMKRQHLADGHKDWDFECPVQVGGGEDEGKREGTA
ncbi:hypothetical protein LTR56_005130 [Elasticomyces elasticus]|nr:hypothetical protein LTR56_005130 [Elasticomyces elasticus]KAK3659586.1 hypothetical protein LTR22_008316 [Elasticomyces elasticus]KAK4921288.1 hypothetical protein LTR49_011291 [Elasticomyces elasticus]KAK5759700.1 hypothetical protein LTS12_010217 [Elasticomyces elasticus]